jgi:hypothetical protein
MERHKREIGYGLRNLLDSVFSVYKRWLGKCVMSRKRVIIVGEVYMKIMSWSFAMKGS